MKLYFRKGSAFASTKARKYLENKTPQDIKNIVVIRHAAIGDWIATRPFLIELRKYFPNAKITLSVIRNYMYGLPEDLVDDIHIVDKYMINDKERKTSIFSRVQQARELPSQDIVFDLTDSTLSLLVTVLSKSKLKVGYPYRLIRRFFYDIAVLRSQFTFETYNLLDQLSMLNAHTMTIPLEYNLTDKTTNLINPYIIYFAGASVKERCWEEEKFIGLIDKMLLKYPKHKHIILKGIRDDEQFDDIYQPFIDNSQVLHQNALPLEEIYDFLAEASLVIVGDTGIRNMAIGTYTPTIGIFFELNAYKYWPRDIKHDCVFNPECTSPSINEVFNAASNLMARIYKV